jgi:hypothetical protein
MNRVLGKPEKYMCLGLRENGGRFSVEARKYGLIILEF